MVYSEHAGAIVKREQTLLQILSDSGAVSEPFHPLHILKHIIFFCSNNT